MKSVLLIGSYAMSCLAFSSPVRGTSLDDYVAAKDPAYGYSIMQTVTNADYSCYSIKMTSQTWRSPAEVNHTLWQHWVTIIKPKTLSSDKALLWINGGSNPSEMPKPNDMLVQIARATNTVCVDLAMVPNQPLVFTDDGTERSEDAIIAYSFDKYMSTGDPSWPVLLPMVKSAVRAMDTVQSLMQDKGPINAFVVSGGSKRGWTTWLSAAVDARVVAIVPCVIDVLNMSPQMKHHHQAYGNYSQAIKDYVHKEIFERFDTPEGQKLLEIVDPYAYRERYTLPKYMINSTGDQFFLPDSSQFYFNKLPGDKYLRYCPNSDHGLDDSGAEQSLLAFYRSILEGQARPRFSWTLPDKGTIRVTTTTAPQRVRLWQATNPETRDFRLWTIDKAWKSSDLPAQAPNSYVAQMTAPPAGWTAFMVELTFDSGTEIPHIFTTEVSVVP
jgi:PhoPQ-activated pathogenicity-related protein